MHPKHEPETDIVNESYRGPNPIIAGFGYGFIEFKAALLVSLGVGITAAMTFPKQVTQALENFTKGSTEWSASSNVLKKATGHIGVGFTKIGEWAESHLPFKEKLQKSILKGERWKPTSMTFGMLSVLSTFVTAFSSTSRGFVVTARAKDQLHRAQSEIKDLRIENAELRERNAELKIDALPDTAPAISPTEAAGEETKRPTEPQPKTTIQASTELASEKALPDQPALQRA